MWQVSVGVLVCEGLPWRCKIKGVEPGAWCHGCEEGSRGIEVSKLCHRLPSVEGCKTVLFLVPY